MNEPTFFELPMVRDFSARNLLVAISTKKKKGDAVIQEFSTGFPVAEGLVLTARHAVFPLGFCGDQPVRIRWWSAQDQGFKAEYKKSENNKYAETGYIEFNGFIDAENTDGNRGIVWECEKLDLALIACAHPPSLGWFCLNPKEPKNGWEVYGTGFPAGANENDQPEWRDIFATMGDRAGDETPHRFQLNSNTQESSWDSASGTALRLKGTNDAIGVLLTKHPNGGDCVLRAVPIMDALSDDKFYQIVFKYDPANLLKALRSEFEAELKKHPEIFEKIKNHYPEISDEQWASEYFCQPNRSCTITSDIDSLIKFFSEERKATTLISILAASRLDVGCCRKINDIIRDASTHYVQTPAFSPIGVELRMALADGRVPLFTANAGEPHGAFRLATPPEGGISGAQASQHDHLVYLLGLELNNSIKAYSVLEARKIKKRDSLFEALKVELKGRRDRNQSLPNYDVSGRYYYCEYIDQRDQIGQSNFNAFAKKVKDNIDDVSVLSMNSDNIEEKRILLPLELTLKSQRQGPP